MSVVGAMDCSREEKICTGEERLHQDQVTLQQKLKESKELELGIALIQTKLQEHNLRQLPKEGRMGLTSAMYEIDSRAIYVHLPYYHGHQEGLFDSRFALVG